MAQSNSTNPERLIRQQSHAVFDCPIKYQLNKKVFNMNEITNKVNEINALHKLAMHSAQEAVTYANKIGKLLLDAKVEIPHGQFLKWIENNLLISPRQAQRYILSASGKDLKLSDFGTKNDKMSHLHLSQPDDRVMNPAWIPSAGYWFKCIDQNQLYVIAPDRICSGDFHITKFQLNEGSTLDKLEIDCDKEMHWTRQPVMASKVELMLHIFGLNYPEERNWKVLKREGIDSPVGIASEYPSSDKEKINV